MEHLLAALLAQEGGLARSILTRAGVNVEALAARLNQDLDRLPKVTGASTSPDQIYVTARLNKLFTKAEDEAKSLKDDFISVEHFLLAATDDSKALKELGVTRDRLMQALREVRGSQRVTTKNPEATYEALEKYEMCIRDRFCFPVPIDLIDLQRAARGGVEDGSAELKAKRDIFRLDCVEILCRANVEVERAGDREFAGDLMGECGHRYRGVRPQHGTQSPAPALRLVKQVAQPLAF